MCPQIHFTKSNLAALPPAPAGKRIDYTDPKSPGLALRVTDSGVKTFSYRQRSKAGGNPVRITIGRFPAVSVEQARAEAAKLRAEFVRGEDPAAILRERKAEPTLGDLYRQYLAARPLRPASVASYGSLVSRHLGDLMGLRISQVTRDRLRQINLPSDAQQVKARALISAIFKWANVEGIIDRDNPAGVIRTRVLKSRERFLQVDEVNRFLAALQTNPQADFFLLCLLTGARKGNVMSMRWQDVNLVEGWWRKPDTKNREPHTVPLVGEAIEILQGRAGIHPTWVFPSRGREGHLVTVQTAWDRLRRESGLADLNIHDLRRTMGSWQAREGVSLTIVGKTLGHKSSASTEVYARLDLEPVRDAMDRALRNLRQ